MPQLIIFTDKEEDEKVIEYSKKWKLSKNETIKKMIKDFEVYRWEY